MKGNFALDLLVFEICYSVPLQIFWTVYILWLHYLKCHYSSFSPVASCSQSPLSLFFLSYEVFYAIGQSHFLKLWSPMVNALWSFPPLLIFPLFLTDFLCACISVICVVSWSEVGLDLVVQEPFLVLFVFLWDLVSHCGSGFPVGLDYLASKPQASTFVHLSSAGVASTTHVWLFMCRVGIELRSQACTAST